MSPAIVLHRFWKKSLLLMGGLFLVLGVSWGLVILAGHWDLFRVSQIVVDGDLHVLSEVDVATLSGVSTETNLIQLDLGKLHRTLSSHPWIRNVTLSKRYPDRLLIMVEEETPVAILHTDGLFLVNRFGEVFKPMESQDPKNLPVISSKENGHVMQQLQDLLYLVSFFEDSESLSRMGLSELAWSEKTGLHLFTTQPVVQIRLGKDLWEERLGKFARTWTEIRKKVHEPKKVDMTHEDRILIRFGS